MFKVNDEGERVWRWWTFMVPEQRPDGTTTLRAGRWFIHSRADKHRRVLSFEWHFRRRSRASLDLTATFTVEEEPGVRLHLGLFDLASFWLTIGLPGRVLSSWMIEERVFGVRFGYIGDIAWIYLGFDDASDSTGMMDYYREKKARGETLHFGGNRIQLTQGVLLKVRFRLRDRLFGKTVYEKVEIARQDVQIPLDGRMYAGVWTLHGETWRRPRLPWSSCRRFGSLVEVEHPPAFSGKGENSWDCDDDAFFSVGSKELTSGGAVGDYVKAVLRQREKYGAPRDIDAFTSR